MDIEKKAKALQVMYASAVADFVLRLGREGILEKVTEEKKVEQMKGGKYVAAQMGISSPQAVFEVLSEVFGCANWKLTNSENGFSAEATSCMMCGMAKKLGAESPCSIYCLNPMEGMIKGINADAEFTVSETLWEGQACHVDVALSK